MKTTLNYVASFIIAVGTLVGMYYVVDTHYAKAGDIEAVREDIMTVSNRIDAMKLEDELLLVKKKIDRLEDRWGQVFYDRFERYWQTHEELKGVMPTDYKKDYTELLEEKDKLEKAIDEKNKVKKGE